MGRPDWFDFWTGEHFTGDQTVKKNCPLDSFQVYVRAESIVPMGPAGLQYATERSAAPYEFRVYPSVNTKFTVYEDDNETYAYERGERATYDLIWNDTAKNITIGARQGLFPRMIAKRKITVSLVTPGSIAVSQTAPRSVETVVYTGQPIVLKFNR